MHVLTPCHKQPHPNSNYISPIKSENFKGEIKSHEERVHLPGTTTDLICDSDPAHIIKT